MKLRIFLIFAILALIPTGLSAAHLSGPAAKPYEIDLSDLHGLWVHINQALVDATGGKPAAVSDRPLTELDTLASEHVQITVLRTEIVQARSLISRALVARRCRALPSHVHPTEALGEINYLYLASGQILDALVVCVASKGRASRPLTSYYNRVRGAASAAQIVTLVRVAQALSAGGVGDGPGSEDGR